MSESRARVRETIPEEIMLGRLAQSEQMREFFIQMWMQNPALAKQGGARVQALLTPLELVDAKEMGSEPSAKPFSPRGKGWEGGKQRGASLVELIMFIVIVSVALAGILLVMNVTTRGSADPLIHKQALAIAESMLEEVELMPFTFCDPDDPAAGLDTTVSAAACVGGAGGANDESKLPLGPETAASVGGAEGRYVSPQFDNVSDYNGCQMNTGVANAGCDITGTGKIKDITGADINDPAGNPIPYKAVVAVAAVALGTITLLSGDALQITVTVTGPDGVDVVVEGIRTRYAPRSVP